MQTNPSHFPLPSFFIQYYARVTTVSCQKWICALGILLLVKVRFPFGWVPVSRGISDKAISLSRVR